MNDVTLRVVKSRDGEDEIKAERAGPQAAAPQTVTSLAGLIAKPYPSRITQISPAQKTAAEAESHPPGDGSRLAAAAHENAGLAAEDIEPGGRREAGERLAPSRGKGDARLLDIGTRSIAAGEAAAVSGSSRPDPGPRQIALGIRGHLDAIVEGCAQGWALDETNPSRRLQIEIWADNDLVAVGEAGQDRHDLVEANIGDGKCAFSIALPRSLADGKTHLVWAKVSGEREALPRSSDFLVSHRPFRAAIEEIDGLTVRGWAESIHLDSVAMDLFVDGEFADSSELTFTAKREPFSRALPLAHADGRVHWIQLKARGSVAVLAETVAALPMVATPEDALRTYARDFPAFLSTHAAYRYESVAAQLTFAAANLEKQIEDGRQLSLAAHLAQLALAHRQVKIGAKEQAREPDPLVFPRYERPDVSIVIPAHNKFWVTYNCLAALLLAPNAHSYEVIVVDDGSSDMTVALSKYVRGITVLRNEASQGFVRSSNLGGQHARGEFVVMLNNDTEPCAAWIDELIFVFANFPDVGLAGAKFTYPDGKLQEAGGIVFPNMHVWNYGRGGNPHDPRYAYTRQVDYVSGACIMLRKTVWDQLGGFDDFFAPAYYEDTDLAFRVRSLGLRTYFTPFAMIIHFEGVSSGTSLDSGVKRYQKINEPKFRSRWASTLRSYPHSLDPEIARDRGVALRALVIDAEMPTPDKDAGSYAALQEMRLLQALGLKLTFVPLNMAYMGNYTEALQRSGVECMYAPFVTSIDQMLERRAKEFDVIYITRYYVAHMYIDKIRAAAPQAKIIFNNADLHFLREIRAAVANKNSALLAKALETRDVELAVMRKTDVTLSYTDTEAAVILSHNLDSTKVARCPWVVDVEENIRPFAERSGLAFLGNYRHPPNEEALRYFILEILPELRRAAPGITLKIFGANMTPEIRNLAREDVAILGHVEDVAEVYQSCRIFVAPLLSGAGIKGKVIGALAAGTPTTMTSLAGEGIGVSRGVEAIIADGVTEWVQSVSSLYHDEARWGEMSLRARDFARRNFSLESGLAKMKAALEMAGVYVG